MKPISSYCFALLLLGLIGCNQDKTTPSVDPSLTLSLSELALSSSAKESTIQIVSNTTWSVSGDVPNWVYVTPTSGNGNTTLSVSVQENTSSTVRSGVVAIKAGEITRGLTITQEAKAVPPTPQDPQLEDLKQENW